MSQNNGVVTVEDARTIAELDAEEQLQAEVIHHTVRLSKDSARRLTSPKDGDKIIKGQINAIVDGVRTSQRSRLGWSIELAYSGTRDWFQVVDNPAGTKTLTGADAVYTTHVHFKVDCSPTYYRPSFDAEFGIIVGAMNDKGKFQGWFVTEVDGEPYEHSKSALEAPKGESSSDELGYAPFIIPDDWDNFFEGLYGLESHISRIKRALIVAQKSGFDKRLNIALIGPPACGKTAVCKAVKRALGGEDAVMELDATSTTMVGAQKDIGERTVLPRVLVVEEIEKAPTGSLPWLLSMLDDRGEVRRTTARGNIHRDTHIVGICTVNDWELFQTINSGSVKSRFSTIIHFRRPSRAILTKILEREIKAYGGDLAWIDKTLDFADDLGTSDPREIIAICLSAGADILTGKFQQEYRDTMEPELQILKPEVV